MVVFLLVVGFPVVLDDRLSSYRRGIAQRVYPPANFVRGSEASQCATVFVWLDDREDESVS